MAAPRHLVHLAVAVLGWILVVGQRRHVRWRSSRQGNEGACQEQAAGQESSTAAAGARDSLTIRSLQ